MELEEIKRLKGVRKVTVLTAYDAQTAKIMDTAGIDMILVARWQAVPIRPATSSTDWSMTRNRSSSGRTRAIMSTK